MPCSFDSCTSGNKRDCYVERIPLLWGLHPTASGFSRIEVARNDAILSGQRVPFIRTKNWRLNGAKKLHLQVFLSGISFKEILKSACMEPLKTKASVQINRARTAA